MLQWIAVKVQYDSGKSVHLVAPGAPSMTDPMSQMQGVATGIEKIKERFMAFFKI